MFYSRSLKSETQKSNEILGGWMLLTEYSETRGADVSDHDALLRLHVIHKSPQAMTAQAFRAVEFLFNSSVGHRASENGGTFSSFITKYY